MWHDFVARRDLNVADIVSELRSKGLCGSGSSELQVVADSKETPLTPR